jgi:hypothetical protein
MKKTLTIENRAINGKSLYVFEGHNLAICAWAEIKRLYPRELILITLDYHTDTEPAFKRYANSGSLSDVPKMRSLIADRISQINLQDNQSLLQAAAELANDEQIDAAIRLNLFTAAFCLNQQNRNTRLEKERRDSESYWEVLFEEEEETILPVSSDRIFSVGEPHAVGWTGGFHDDHWDNAFADQAIETVMLRQLLKRANVMAATIDVDDICSRPYVLDIDLDYFRTKNSLTPKDPSAFHDLVQRARAITIATEPSFVMKLKLDGEVTAEFALGKVIEQIKSALAI